MNGRAAKKLRRARQAPAPAPGGTASRSAGESLTFSPCFPGNAYSARDLPALRARQVSMLTRRPAANAAWNTYRQYAAAGRQEAADPAVTDPAAQATLLAGNEAARLRTARLFWMPPDVTAQARALAASMPPFRPAPEDLPAPAGLMYFAAPLATYAPSASLITAAGMTTLLPPEEEMPFCAVSWGPFDAAGTWPGGGTWFTLYTPGPRSAEQAARRYRISLDAAERMGIPPLLADRETACPASPDIPLPSGRSLEEELRSPRTGWPWTHLVLCAFRVLESRLTESRGEQVPRSARARAARARVDRPEEDVQVVCLRPRTARDRAAEEPAPEPGGAERRSPGYRYPVGPFLRWQWYPRQGRHRLILVDEFPRGPKEAPYRPRAEKVYTIRAPGPRPQPPSRRRQAEPEM